MGATTESPHWRARDTLVTPVGFGRACMHDAMGNSGASSGIQVSFIVALVDFQGCGMGVRGVAGVEKKAPGTTLGEVRACAFGKFLPW